MKLITLTIVMFIISAMPLTAGHGQGNYEFKFQYAKISVDGASSSVNISLNSSEYIEIEFNKIYVGTMDLLQFPRFYYGSLKGMNVSEEYGKSESMGNYLHIKMWKETQLIRFGWGETHRATVVIDFYVASENYTKKGVLVDKNTLRYDITITTDCPGDFIYLSHRISTGGMGEENVFSKHGPHWESIEKTTSKKWMNFTSCGNMGFGKSWNNLSFLYLWNASNVNSLYSYWDNHVDLYFVYSNTGTIVQDPYVKLPVPIFTNTTEVAGKIVDYFMEHTISISIGIGAAVAIIFVPAVLRRRKMSQL